MKSLVGALLIGLGLSVAASALPVNLRFTGTFETDWMTGEGPGAGSAYSIQADIETDSMSLMSSSWGSAYYQGVVSWSGLVGSTNFSWSGLTSIDILDGTPGPHSSNDMITLQLTNHGDLFGTGSDSAQISGYFAGPSTTFSGVGLNNLLAIGALTTTHTFEVHEHSPSWGLYTSTGSASVPEPKLSELF